MQSASGSTRKTIVIRWPRPPPSVPNEPTVQRARQADARARIACDVFQKLINPVEAPACSRKIATRDRNDMINQRDEIAIDQWMAHQAALPLPCFVRRAR